MLNMGRRSAYARLGHFLCEVGTRLAGSDLPRPECIVLPFTQADLADILGLSVVHINRVLQRMRREKLIKLSHGRLEVLDREQLEAVTGFDGSYLQPILGA